MMTSIWSEGNIYLLLWGIWLEIELSLKFPAIQRYSSTIKQTFVFALPMGIARSTCIRHFFPESIISLILLDRRHKAKHLKPKQKCIPCIEDLLKSRKNSGWCSY